MKIQSAIFTLVGCTGLGAVIGGGIGYGLGKLSPEYYQSVFERGNEQSFDPVAVGLGQGVTQGAVGGIVVGLVLVVLFVWRDVLLSAQGDPNQEHHAPRRRISVGLLIFAVIIGVLALCSVSILVFGLNRPDPRHQLNRNVTKQLIESLKKGLELYALDHNGNYPSTAQGLKALYVRPEDDPAWDGPYVAVLNDVWGTPIQYAEPSGDRGPRKPVVWSLGRDKASNTSDDVQ